jgi:hypothetical protein
MNKSVSNLCIILYKELNDNKDLLFYEKKFEQKPAPSNEVKPEWPDAIQSFYRELNGLEIHWEHMDYPEDSSKSGRIRILRAEEIAPKGSRPVWFEFTPEDSPMRSFHIIDYFIDEAAVGFYDNAPEMHFYEFESKTIPMGIDFNGYIQLLKESRGYFYWQRALLAIKNNKENTESKQFKENMPVLFPSFSFEEFKKLYDSLRIK